MGIYYSVKEEENNDIINEEGEDLNNIIEEEEKVLNNDFFFYEIIKEKKYKIKEFLAEKTKSNKIKEHIEKFLKRNNFPFTKVKLTKKNIRNRENEKFLEFYKKNVLILTKRKNNYSFVFFILAVKNNCENNFFKDYLQIEINFKFKIDNETKKKYKKYFRQKLIMQRIKSINFEDDLTLDKNFELLFLKLNKFENNIFDESNAFKILEKFFLVK